MNTNNTEVGQGREASLFPAEVWSCTYNRRAKNAGNMHNALEDACKTEKEHYPIWHCSAYLSSAYHKQMCRTLASRTLIDDAESLALCA